MSKVRFVCLANSFKEGGKCVAGIVLDENNNPIFENENPKWVRPICNTVYGEIPSHFVANINIFDIIELEPLYYPNSHSYQSENVLFMENSFRVVGKYDENNLNVLYSSDRLIFGNRGKAIAQDNINRQNHSLMFIKTTEFEAYKKTYDDSPKSQIRIKFTYYGFQYDLPVTDPVFLKKYQISTQFLNAYSQMNLTLSIGVEHEGWYYKLIAGVILSC